MSLFEEIYLAFIDTDKLAASINFNRPFANNPWTTATWRQCHKPLAFLESFRWAHTTEY